MLNLHLRTSACHLLIFIHFQPADFTVHAARFSRFSTGVQSFGKVHPLHPFATFPMYSCRSLKQVVLSVPTAHPHHSPPGTHGDSWEVSEFLRPKPAIISPKANLIAMTSVHYSATTSMHPAPPFLRPSSFGSLKEPRCVVASNVSNSQTLTIW